jgi:hypothetical protein
MRERVGVGDFSRSPAKIKAARRNAKISGRARKGKPLSAKHRAKISEAMQGNTNAAA